MKYSLGINWWLFALITLVVLLAVLFMPVALSWRWIDFFDLTKVESARIGDAIGGITAPFVAIIAAAITFIAFWVQYMFNKDQSEYLEKERFEHNFYEMLSIHESITESLELEIYDDTVGVSYEDHVINRKKGRDVFQFLYESYPIDTISSGRIFNWKGSMQYTGLRELFQKSNNNYQLYTESNVIGKLDHYFRQLYRIFRMIEDKEELTSDEKYHYGCIVRSTLSQYELILLFYNGLSQNGCEKFKPLIEDYTLLNNIRIDLLAREDDRVRYAEKFTVNYQYEPDDAIIQGYKKKAFVRKIV